MSYDILYDNSRLASAVFFLSLNYFNSIPLGESIFCHIHRISSYFIFVDDFSFLRWLNALLSIGHFICFPTVQQHSLTCKFCMKIYVNEDLFLETVLQIA